MKPIKFKECNCVFAESQDEYKSLPAFVDKNGIVVTCYKLSFIDIVKVIFTGKLWSGVMTFRKPLQPQLLSVSKEDIITK